MIDFPKQLQLAQQGDLDARDVITREFDWVVERSCRQLDCLIAPDISQADMRQEAWLRVWTQIEHFRFMEDAGATGGFVNWLGKTSRNACLNIISQRQGPTRLPNGGIASLGQIADHLCDKDLQTASTVARGKEKKERVLAAIASLHDELARTVVSLCFFEGLTLKAIAKKCSLTYDQVRYAFRQAMRELSEKLDDGEVE